MMMMMIHLQAAAGRQGGTLCMVEFEVTESALFPAMHIWLVVFPSFSSCSEREKHKTRLTDRLTYWTDQVKVPSLKSQ